MTKTNKQIKKLLIVDCLTSSHIIVGGQSNVAVLLFFPFSPLSPIFCCLCKMSFSLLHDINVAKYCNFINCNISFIDDINFTPRKVKTRQFSGLPLFSRHPTHTQYQRSWKLKIKIPSEMEVAPRYNLLVKTDISATI